VFKLIPIILCLVISSCNARDANTKSLNMHSGAAYLTSFNTAIACRDLTEEEMEEAENIPGGGYSDGKWTGENPPQNQDDDGNPTYN